METKKLNHLLFSLEITENMPPLLLKYMDFRDRYSIGVYVMLTENFMLIYDFFQKYYSFTSEIHVF